MDWAEKFEEVPPDSSMQTNLEFLQDKRPEKINAGIGMLMDEKTGRAFVPEVIQRVGKALAFEDVGYLPSEGHRGYLEGHARELVFGPELWDELKGSHNEGKPDGIVWAQALGGTNALFWAARLLEQALPNDCRRLLIDPGWPNHQLVFRPFQIISYTHEDPESREYRHDEHLDQLEIQPDGCPVLLQVCGYNDDGTERSQAQWNEIIDVIAAKKFIPVLDFAYNGLVEGWDSDAYSVRALTKKGIPAFICVSNSKNVAYNARLGSLYVVNIPVNTARKMQQTLANEMIRAHYSNPPALPAQVFSKILHDELLFSEYKREIDAVRRGVLEFNRWKFAEALGPDSQWITKKRGLFFKLLPNGFSEKQLHFLKDEHAIHGPQSSRINIGGLPPSRIVEIAHIYKQALAIP